VTEPPPPGNDGPAPGDLGPPDTAGRPPARPRSRWDTARILLLVFGSLATLLALVLLGAGGTLIWANSQKDADGFFTTAEHRFSSPSFAIVSDDLDLGEDGPDWLFEQGRLGTIRIDGAGTQGPVFVGIAPKTDAEAYLRDVPHSVVTQVTVDPFRVDYRAAPGGQRQPREPESQLIWAAFSTGPTVTMNWDVDSGNWVAVLMNADASRGVSADLSFGARVGWLVWLIVGLLIAGALVLTAGATMLVFGIRGPRGEAPQPVSSP
jgi:hypothetical protein